MSPGTGPARGVRTWHRRSATGLYLRDPNGVGIEFYREGLGRFEGEPLLS